MEYCEIDLKTKQVLSAGSNVPMEGGEIVEVPELPQRKGPTINICDYYWDGTKFVNRPEGNIIAERVKESQLENPTIKAIIDVLEKELKLPKGYLRAKIKDRL